MELVNKKVSFDYDVIEKFEAGIVLTGEEVKAIRSNNVDFGGSHVMIVGGEAFVINLHIGIKEGDTRKTRKLLLNKKEIISLKSKKEAGSLTIVPTKLYNNGTKFKLEVALVRGKKTRQKRDSLKKADIRREIERELREINK